MNGTIIGLSRGEPQYIHEKNMNESLEIFQWNGISEVSFIVIVRKRSNKNFHLNLKEHCRKY